MCGIIGIVGNKPVVERLMNGLKGLEYRGYDSNGIATITRDGLQRRRAKGKLNNLQELVAKEPIAGFTGIGHLRWATHGKPTVENAHPHSNNRIAIVHNGIIENHEELRQELKAQGVTFESETDTEVVLHMVDQYCLQGMSPKDAVYKTLQRLHGAYALAFVFAEYPEMVIGARKSSPLAIGYGDGEMYLGSDSMAMAELTNKVSYLNDDDMVVLTPTSAEIIDGSERIVSRPIVISNPDEINVSKDGYNHFMIKEIFEQPEVIRRILSQYLNEDHDDINMPKFGFNANDIPRFTIVACGTAFYSGMVAKYWIEELTDIPVEIDIASEFRYRNPPLPQGGVAIFVSQSGETADTLAALEYAKQHGQYTVGLVNVQESSLARAVDLVLPTYAGREIGVASTKAFMSQLTVFLCFALEIAKQRGINIERLCRQLASLPNLVNVTLALEPKVKELSKSLLSATDVLYLGRGSSYPIALEGALKLKEISYIHAEGFAAGEMKHGPIALIDHTVPVVIIAPTDRFFEKTISNMQEVMARGGQVILIGDQQGVGKITAYDLKHITLPVCEPLLTPLLYSIPIQLLAYFTAALKGTDVDQPRNLAKSVTVE